MGDNVGGFANKKKKDFVQKLKTVKRNRHNVTQLGNPIAWESW